MANAKSTPDLLPESEQKHIVVAIEQAEKTTTGEIRVFVESSCMYVDAMERAKEVFAQLEMHQTVHRNATLVYVALRDKQFALFGDEAIYQLTGGPDFWKEAAAQMVSFFRNEAYGEGIAAAVKAIGSALAQHFPGSAADTPNELPDDIVFGA